MCIHHITHYTPCGHYVPNLSQSTNTHCTHLQHLLFHYHDQPDITTNSSDPAPSSPLPCPRTCPPNPPFHDIHTNTAYIPLPSLAPHPSAAAEHRAHRAWGRFHSRDELNYFFFLASGLPARPTGRYSATHLPPPPPPPTPADEPTLPQLAARYDFPPGTPNVQVTPVCFGCGQGWGPNCWLGRRRWEWDQGGFSQAELDRAVEEEERIATHRARRSWWADGGRDRRGEELVLVGGGMAVRKRHLAGWLGSVVAGGGDVIPHLRAMAEREGERGLVNGVGGRRRRGSCPEMEVGRGYGRGRSYSV